MDLFSLEFFIALGTIIAIDIVLAGDNALLIGLAARNLSKELQKKAIIWGTVGAILIRMVATLIVVQLLMIKGLLLVGGVVLLFIAYKLMVQGKDHHVESKNTFWGAMGTIIIADALMGIDNVLAVAGAAHGSFLLVVIGLIVSVPIVVWGSTLIIKWTDKYPVIITIGAAILAWTASKMIVGEPLIEEYFENGFIKYSFEILVVATVVVLGAMKKKIKSKK